MLDVSLVIPLLNEEESLPELTDWIHKVCTENQLNYEIIFIDDGSTDKSWKLIQQLSDKNKNIKGIKFRKNYGKSAALNTGFDAAKGSVVITMDADLQDSPDEIPELVRMIRKDGYDLVSGWKKVRHDPLSKTMPSKLFNRTTSIVSGIKLHDFNCGLKAYRLDVVKGIEVYGEMHRYIPVIAKSEGFKSIGEKVVAHQARKHGKSKFGGGRLIKGFLDLMSITFISKFGKRPMHFFGTIGTFLFLFGFIIGFYLAYQKIVNSVAAMTDRPLFYLGIMCMIIGVQLFVAGFLGEMISRNSVERNKYQIETTYNM